MRLDQPQPIDTVFTLLDRWRHFPAYQLERRADVFFAAYLREVLEGETSVPLHQIIIPELPIKRDLIWPNHPTSKSVKLDYALFAADLSTAYFIELKTDVGSRRSSQDEYLERAKQLGFKKLVEGIRSIVLATTAHQKYHHLTSALAELGFLSLPPDLQDFLYPQPRPGLTERLRAIVVADINPTIDVRYLQPLSTEGDSCIDFETFATYVDCHDDPLSALFARHLRRWTTAAGSSPRL